MMSFKKIMNCPSYGNLLSSPSTDQANIPDVMDFIIHVIYNRPNRDKSPGDSGYAMLFVGKGTKRKFASTKSLIPDAKSLKMKILRSNLVSHGWVNCLNPTYEGLDPLKYGWKIENDILRPLWFDGAPLPSKKELNENVEGRIDLIPTDEPETEHTDDDGSNDESVCVPGDEMDIEWEDNEVSVSLQTFFSYHG